MLENASVKSCITLLHVAKPGTAVAVSHERTAADLSYGKYCFKSLKASSFISVQIRQFAEVETGCSCNFPNPGAGADVHAGADEGISPEFAGKSDV